MKARAGLLAFTLLSFGFAPSASAKDLRVAVVVDGPTDLFEHTNTALKHQVDELFRESRTTITFPAAPTHVGAFTAESVAAQFQAALASRDYDLIIGLGFLTGQVVAKVEQIGKPVILPFAVPRLQGLPRDGRSSGRKNLAYVAGLLALERDLRGFQEVVRRGRVAVLVDRYIFDAIGDRLPKEQKTAEKGGMKVTVVPVGAAAQDIIAVIPADAEAVYLSQLVRLPRSDIKPLIDAINKRRLPSYAVGGRSWVEQGAFTSLVPDDDLDRRLRRVALYIQDVASGGKLETFDTGFAQTSQLLINMTTAKAIGVSPHFALMTEAELIGADVGERGPKLSLPLAIGAAMENNLEYDVARRDISVAEAGLRESRGSLLPQVNVDGSYTWIDPDVASSFGSAERTLSWGMSAQQMIYAPLAISAYAAQKKEVLRVTAGVDASRLDLVLDVATAYLNYLRARTSERITRENLQRIRKNLALAEMRVEVGSSGPQDVARWNIEVAGGRADAIASSARRNQTEIAVNQLLNRPLEAPFSAVEPTEPDAGVVIDPRVEPFVENPASFRMFRDFVVTEAIRQSPELQQLDQGIAAQKDLLTGYVRQLYLPNVFINGGFTHTIDRSGAGSQAVATPGFPSPDPFTWQLGAALQFRLFDDARYGTIDQIERSLAQLDTQRRAIAQRIEQNARTALHATGSSGAAVELRQDAAEAAQTNLDAVSDSYQQGVVTIITLIDAQNQALLTRLAAADAVYQYLADYLSVERASGSFGVLRSKEEQQEYITRLTEFVADKSSDQNGANP